MSDQPWFKHWGKESLASPDIQSLTDHEFRVWWSLLEVASIQPERWTIRLSRPVLARMCGSSPDKLKKALREIEKRRMVLVDEANGTITICNWQRYQDSPEAARKRKQRQEQAGQVTDMSRTRPGKDAGHVTPNVTGEERGKRKEERLVAAVAATSAAAGTDEPDEDAIRDAITAWTEATGTLASSLVGDQIAGWLTDYPRPWVLDAIRETGLAGAKSAKYADAILKRWRTEGRDTPKAAPKPTAAPVARFWPNEVAEMEAERARRQAVAK